MAHDHHDLFFGDCSSSTWRTCESIKDDEDDISDCLPRFARTGSGSKTGSGQDWFVDHRRIVDHPAFFQCFSICDDVCRCQAWIIQRNSGLRRVRRARRARRVTDLRSSLKLAFGYFGCLFSYFSFKKMQSFHIIPFTFPHFPILSVVHLTSQPCTAGFAWAVFSSHRDRDEALHKMLALEKDRRGSDQLIS